jgi:hypothetical protein
MAVGSQLPADSAGRTYTADVAATVEVRLPCRIESYASVCKTFVLAELSSPCVVFHIAYISSWYNLLNEI